MTTGQQRQPIRGPMAWRGDELAAATDWIHPLSPGEIAEIDAAMAAARAAGAAAGTALLDVGREEFPLPGLSRRLAAIAADLENGRGVALLRGLPAERYGEDGMRLALWGLGAHLGTAVSQSLKGELLGEVRDEGVVLGQANSRGYRTRQSLRFHTDRCDVVALLCVRKARAGGSTRFVSSVAIHNEILARRPDLLDTLYGVYHHSRQSEEAPGEERFYRNPVFAVEGGRFTSQFSRSYVESAQAFAEVPRLTVVQDEALDMLLDLAGELCFTTAFEPGDLQLLNNHVTYHARSAYDDDGPELDGPEHGRLLLRLWLSMPNSRALPAGFETLWRATAAGAIRGGVRPASGPLHAGEHKKLHVVSI